MIDVSSGEVSHEISELSRAKRASVSAELERQLNA